MAEIEYCETMADVRRNIDRLDVEIVKLLTERAAYVAQAARIKDDPNTVRLEDRIEEVVTNVKRLAGENGLKPEIVEAAYRPMVDAYIDFEMEEFHRIRETTDE